MKQYHTQMEAAKMGIITPEMEIVAKKEYMEPEKLRALVAKGEVAIPCNVNHKSISPEGIGTGMRTKINVNLGISGDAKNYDVEMRTHREVPCHDRHCADVRCDRVSGEGSAGDHGGRFPACRSGSC